MRSLRLSLLLLLVLSLLLPTATAYAQEDVDVYCDDLSEEDCQLLIDSRMAMNSLTSYAASVDLDMNLQGVPTLPEDLGLALASDGVFAVDPEITAGLQAMQGLEPEEMLENFDELMALSNELYSSLGVNMEWELNFSDDLAALLGATTNLPLSNGLNLGVRMKDGFFYLNIADLAELAPDLEGLGEWIGIDLAGMMAANTEQALKALEDMEMADNLMAASMALANIQQNQMMREIAEKYVSIDRLDDTTVGDVDVAQFRYNFDLASFLTDPEIIGFFVDQIKMQMANDPGMAEGISPSDLDAIVGFAPMMGPMLLSGMQFETVSSVGLEDKYVYATETMVDWDMTNLLRMLSQFGVGGRASGNATPGYNYSLNVQNSDFNADVDIEVPDNPIIIPLDEMGMMSVM